MEEYLKLVLLLIGLMVVILSCYAGYSSGYNVGYNAGYHQYKTTVINASQISCSVNYICPQVECSDAIVAINN